MKITITYLVIELAFQCIPVYTGRMTVWQDLGTEDLRVPTKQNISGFLPPFLPFFPFLPLSPSISLSLLPQIVVDADEFK